MSRIVLFGAGGTFGRTFIKEATGRGHRITAVVRDPAKHADLAGDDVTVVEGDALDVARVAEVAAGHDVAVTAVNMFPGAPRAYLADTNATLLAGLADAGVGRLLIAGGAGSLEVAPGTLLVDTPDFPDAYKAPALAHADALAKLRAEHAGSAVDWVFASPAAFLDPDGPRTGAYRVGGDQLLASADGQSHISYADFAVAFVDEIETPRHHRERVHFAD
jgi:putative NADH-flavin reductase